MKKPIKEIINFPDENFKKYLVEKYDIDGDGEISIEEALEVKKLNLTGMYDSEKSNYEGLNISNLDGIEYFTNLTRLVCKCNPLTSIDVSKNKLLAHLSCDGIYILSEINISGCKELSYLNCSKTNLSSLDISSNWNLSQLYCGGCNITNLDTRNNSLIKYLSCYYNELSSIDISQNKLLEYFNIRHNNLMNLDVSHNIELKQLHCQDNKLISLDVSKNIELETFCYYSNSLSTVDTTHNPKYNKKLQEALSDPKTIRLNSEF